MILHSRNATRGSRYGGSPVRKGGVTAWVLIAAGLFIAFFLLMLDVAGMWQARQDLLGGADASSLAAAGKLIDDDMLLGDAKYTAFCMKNAHDEARAYGYVHPVQGSPLILMANETNEPGGDVEFGWLDSPHAGKFQNVACDQLYPRHDSLCPPINAVRVYAQRTRERNNACGLRLGRAVGHSSADVTARATAYLDRDIIGFRVPEKQALPFAPLALFSDRAVLGGLQAEDLEKKQFQAGLKSWEGQTVLPVVQPALGAGSDQWHFHKDSKRFFAVNGQGVAPDGLYEMEVLLPLGFVAGKGDVPPNARLVKIGGKTTDWPDFWDVYARQIDAGLTAADLADFAGQLTLRADNQKRLRLPLSSMAALPAQESDELEMLLAALVRLRDSAEPRIWPLYSHVTEGADGEGTTDLSGFVAARIAHLEIVALPASGQDSQEPKPYLRLVLQPAMMATPTAVTDHQKRLDFPQIENPYLVKVRLVE